MMEIGASETLRPSGIAPRWLERTSDVGLGCYIHLPFCDRICPYCDFAVVRYRNEKVERYLRVLLGEIRDAAGTPGAALRPLQTLYLGGGTPSAMPYEALHAILSTTFGAFQTRPGSIECTLEANPARNVSDLPLWRKSGVNRLSVGVQSFDDADLHRLGREHNSAQAVACIQAARSAGFTNVSVDLIAGVPGQTLVSFMRTLENALALEVDHISVYGLTVEPGTPYAAWQSREPGAFADDDALADLLDAAHDVFSAAGFHRYEISNFAIPGFESAHNTGYWRLRDCIAFGMSAAGYEGGLRYRNHRDYETYCAARERGDSARAEEERLPASARLGEAAMLALRTSAGIAYGDFAARFGINIPVAFDVALKKCMDAGLLEQDARGARLTRRGRLLANAVCAEFVAPQLPPVGTH